MLKMALPIVALLFAVSFTSCSMFENPVASGQQTFSKTFSKTFGKTSAGHPVTLYTLTNANGMRAGIIDYGATVVSLHVPDRNGKFVDVVIGYDNMTDYQERSHNFGATIGRVAGRISNGRFTVDGSIYPLQKNLGEHTVHGGPVGFDKVMWRAIDSSTESGTVSLTLRYLSVDGEMGFPGNLTVDVTYALTSENALSILYRATTDKATPINLTHHGYFNLKGEGSGDVLDHRLWIDASRTPSTVNMMPTGQIESIENTALDFRTPRRIGERIQDPTLEQRRGYNNYYIFDNYSGALAHVATLSEKQSGGTLEVWTTEPGLQLYTGNYLNDQLVGKSGQPYRQYGGVCLETQHYPDSPNQAGFPDTILRPGDIFLSTTVYKFGSDMPRY